jgi:hypothetical protein
MVILLVNGSTVISNEVNKQFMASSEEHRRAAFRIILAGAGETCHRHIKIDGRFTSTSGHHIASNAIVAGEVFQGFYSAASDVRR